MASAFLFEQQRGRLELSGRDRLDLLHRMSTNDMLTMQPGEGRSTVLTTALARIIDRLIVYHRGETTLALTNYPDKVRAWLQRHIFFQDQVKLRDISAQWKALELYGEGAAAIAESIAPGASALALHHFIDQGTTLTARTFPLAGEGFIFVTAEPDRLRELIVGQPSIAVGDAAQYEALRVAGGLPGPDHELTEDYIPLEAGLWDSVSFSKGCYIGQEIIARMESRNRLAKTLVRLRLAAPVSIGARLVDQAEEKVGLGTVTSAATQADGTALALGFVKPDQASAHMLAIGDSGTPIAAEAIEIATRP